MTIVLYDNNSPFNKVEKDITQVGTLTGTLRGEADVVHPRILIETDVLPDFNYAEISTFGRYYYLEDVKNIRRSLWEITLKSDPLMSFKDVVYNSSGIVKNTEAFGANDYLDAEMWVRTAKDKTDIYPFPSGLLDSGEYILITAGG